ncbi:hypothetical protein M885DRAFT_527660 [Pelagophyceae sp. CCMP2097]|nr:hypothetical protein M885DRAFT_527660 [Pelagophyceae sp. CCMP2097]|mmetsp:Transcript_31938/g.107561  ORF Transcript_31938/g.107561 Transcript_31938/m.107561 type:complete len:128 (-) Transcript_31938:61-444(-)
MFGRLLLRSRSAALPLTYSGAALAGGAGGFAQAGHNVLFKAGHNALFKAFKHSAARRFKITGTGDIKCKSINLGHNTGYKRPRVQARKRAQNRLVCNPAIIRKLKIILGRRKHKSAKFLKAKNQRFG